MLKEMFKKNLADSSMQKKLAHLYDAQVPEGLFDKCDTCNEIVYLEDVVQNFYICPVCGNYFRISPRTRLSMVLDTGSFTEWDVNLPVSDPLCFPGYQEKLNHLRMATGLDDAVVTGKGTIDGMEVAIGVMASTFLMGSMGETVGEKITRLIETATGSRLPVILFCCSGGARMQEGIVSLMQMAKTAGAIKKHDEAGLLYIPVLTDPTTGGVMASFAMLGDIILAEPGALIGFAGPRVIEQTIGQKLPEGFQSAEFLLEHGFIDKVVKRNKLKQTLSLLIKSTEKSK
ncbi:acetyl-CoA carboxylase, carboxyltransferase subunit beta [Anaerocolumna xylanovorans]|uniref:Acetyl-coenzyme A carboxylase carboxyl transferase subunit beta n=1 Tax=Anaerocolumna xylanovorans DSM 12503 TaxID=1121345 RepID=A0A1M7YH00_9FIRM|nr:acetyl-CoA carboxylase, carboxyltransferase subunit beta [Anaerocolumna xylanovorans]SHO51849.1 acetyl-CoA carboxylase carboxyl transferase subunit beta [Anaerocolumna xylanovorans DSM 12503]